MIAGASGAARDQIDVALDVGLVAGHEQDDIDALCVARVASTRRR